MNSQNRTSRNKIAQAALAEFAEHGFAGARVARIADRAKLNKQLVFYYFGSKAELYDTLMAEAGQAFREDYRARIEGNGRHATDRIRSLVAAVLSGLSQRPHLLRLLLWDGAQGGQPHRTAQSFLSELEGAFVQLISGGQGIGYFRDDVDPAVIAKHAVRLLVGHASFQTHQSHDHAVTAEEISRLLLRSLAW